MNPQEYAAASGSLKQWLDSDTPQDDGDGSSPSGSRPGCCLTEAGLECPECHWHGCERTAKDREDPINGVLWDCPVCGEQCAHTPLDEVEHPEDHPCECAGNAESIHH